MPIAARSPCAKCCRWSREKAPSPCETCREEPCLAACPVGAFRAEGYDVPACIARLRSPSGRACLARGCKARRACPIGRARRYEPPQAEFHMHGFLAAVGQLAGFVPRYPVGTTSESSHY